MPYTARAEAASCLYDDFKCFLIKTMQPEYRRHSSEVPQADWQQQFDRLEAWIQTAHYGQIAHDDTYARQQHKFPLNILHAQESLIRHIKDEVSNASSFLAEAFEKQAENESEKSGKGTEIGEGSGEWTVIEEGSENILASEERKVEGLSDKIDSQDQILSHARRLGSEGQVLEGHHQEIANTIACLDFMTRLTGSRKRPDFNELDAKLFRKKNPPNYDTMSRSELRRELLEKIELNEARLERCSELLDKTHMDHWTVKASTQEVLLTPSTASSESEESSCEEESS